MANVTLNVTDAKGNSAGSIEAPADIFGISDDDVQSHVPLIHQVVIAQLAAARQGTHSTKNRGAVSGGGKKPWKQKGTGRARQGSIRAVQWVGGGVPFGPKPHSHARRTNNKEVKLAMRSVLSGKLADSELFVVDDYGFEKPSTKQAVALLKAFGIDDKRVTVVVPDEDVNTYLSFRNLNRVRVIGVGEATAHNLIDNGALLMSADVATKLEEVLA